MREYRPWGASLRGVWRETAEGADPIVTAYSGAKGKVGGQGDVLIPFPGRVRDGRYTANGVSYQMEQNDKDGPNAIHGFLRLILWQVEERTPSSCTFAVDLASDSAPGYPFALHATVTYTLVAEGLTCRFTVTNTGDAPAPVAAGFHPYFTVGSSTIDRDELLLPFASYLEFENLLPTGAVLPVAGSPYDFRILRTIGETAFNTCFCAPLRDADGLVRIRLAPPDGDRVVTVWMDASFDYVVLYSGDPLPDTHRRRSLAIEPMTCGSDAFNHPGWGMVTLAPGNSFGGAWGVQV